jgi:hypothetical protein
MNKYEIKETQLAGEMYLYAKSAVEAFGDYLWMFPDANSADVQVKFLEEVRA